MYNWTLLMAAFRKQTDAAVFKGSRRVPSDRSVCSDICLLIRMGNRVLSYTSVFVYERSFSQ